MDGKSDATRIETTRIILFLSRSRQNMINNLNFGSVKSLDIVPLDSSLGETRRHRLARNHTINPRLTATLLPRFSRKINVIYLYARAYGRERSTATTFRKKPGSPPVNRAACTEIYVYRGARGKRTLIERNCWATPPTSLPLLRMASCITNYVTTCRWGRCHNKRRRMLFAFRFYKKVWITTIEAFNEIRKSAISFQGLLVKSISRDKSEGWLMRSRIFYGNFFFFFWLYGKSVFGGFPNLATNLRKTPCRSRRQYGADLSNSNNWDTPLLFFTSF